MALINNAFQRYQQFGVNGRGTDNSTVTSSNYNNSNNLSNNNAYKQYQQSTINTATPQELTLMLYNGLVRFLKLSEQGIEEKNIEKANNNIIRAQDIITEFMCTLDMQYEISSSLFALYEYMNRRLIEANIKKDKAIVVEIIGYAEELRDTWAQAMKLAKQQALAQQVAE